MRNKSSSGAIALIAVFAFLMFPAFPAAQDIFGATLGIAVPYGELNNVSGAGYSVGADAFFQVFDTLPNFLLGGRISFNDFGTHDYSEFGPDATSTASSLAVYPAVRYYIGRDVQDEEERVNYFLQFGGGLYITSVSFQNFPDADDDTSLNFGASVGGGISYRLLSTISVFAMPIMHLTEDNFLSLNVGVVFGR